MFCRKCGKETGDDDVFCRFCGAGVETASTTEAYQPQTPKQTQQTAHPHQDISHILDQDAADKREAAIIDAALKEAQAYIKRKPVLGLLCYGVLFAVSLIVVLIFNMGDMVGLDIPHTLSTYGTIFSLLLLIASCVALRIVLVFNMPYEIAVPVLARDNLPRDLSNERMYIESAVHIRYSTKGRIYECALYAYYVLCGILFGGLLPATLSNLSAAILLLLLFGSFIVINIIANRIRKHINQEIVAEWRANLSS